MMNDECKMKNENDPPSRGYGVTRRWDSPVKYAAHFTG
jgi:hypothetical protein